MLMEHVHYFDPLLTFTNMYNCTYRVMRFFRQTTNMAILNQTTSSTNLRKLHYYTVAKTFACFAFQLLSPANYADHAAKLKILVTGKMEKNHLLNVRQHPKLNFCKVAKLKIHSAHGMILIKLSTIDVTYILILQMFIKLI